VIVVFYRLSQGFGLSILFFWNPISTLVFGRHSKSYLSDSCSCVLQISQGFRSSLLFFWNPISTLVFVRHSKWLKWQLYFTHFSSVFVHLFHFFGTLFQPSYLGGIISDLSDSCVLQVVPGFWFIYSIFLQPYSNPRIEEAFYKLLKW